MSHRGLETDNRDPGAGFGSLRSRVQRFLRLGIYWLHLQHHHFLHPSSLAEGATTIPKIFGQTHPRYGEFGSTFTLRESKNCLFTECFSQASTQHALLFDDHEAEISHQFENYYVKHVDHMSLPNLFPFLPETYGLTSPSAQSAPSTLRDHRNHSRTL